MKFANLFYAISLEADYQRYAHFWHCETREEWSAFQWGLRRLP